MIINMMEAYDRHYAIGRREKTVRVYMCMTDWEEEVSSAVDGVRVFPSERALREYHECVNHECGIVAVDVTYIATIKEPEAPSDERQPNNDE